MRLMQRRALLTAILAAPVAGLCDIARGVEPMLLPPPLGRDGLFVEDWLRASSGDLRRDLDLAAGEGKVLVLIWERAGCEYCAMLHLEALRDPALRDYAARRFYSVRLDRLAEQPVIDFDGVRRPQHAVAVRHGVLGTPTMEFLLADGREVLRLPGYADPRILLAAFEYVQFGGYLHTGIVGWLQKRGLL